MKNLCYFIGLFLTLLLSSCLEGHEEYWINRDGSGKLAAHYSLPTVAISDMGGESALQSKIQSFFAENGKVTLSQLDTKIVGTSVTLDIKIDFNNASDIVDLLSGKNGTDATSSKPDPIDQLLGTMDAKINGLAVAVERNIDIRNLFPNGILSPKSSQIRGCNLEYIIHLPVSPHQSNAHVTTDNGQTLQWKFPLALALKEPLHIEVTAPIPIPHWIIATALIFLISLTIFIIWMIKKFIAKKRA